MLRCKEIEKEGGMNSKWIQTPNFTVGRENAGRMEKIMLDFSERRTIGCTLIEKMMAKLSN